MPRHVLTIEEKIRGIRRAIASPRTPPHLKKFLRERREILIAKARPKKLKRRAMPKRSPGLLDWLGL
jgi:hypothetical protein